PPVGGKCPPAAHSTPALGACQSTISFAAAAARSPYSRMSLASGWAREVGDRDRGVPVGAVSGGRRRPPRARPAGPRLLPAAAAEQGRVGADGRGRHGLLHLPDVRLRRPLAGRRDAAALEPERARRDAVRGGPAIRPVLPAQL